MTKELVSQEKTLTELYNELHTMLVTQLVAEQDSRMSRR